MDYKVKVTVTDSRDAGPTRIEVRSERSRPDVATNHLLEVHEITYSKSGAITEHAVTRPPGRDPVVGVMDSVRFIVEQWQ